MFVSRELVIEGMKGFVRPHAACVEGVLVLDESECQCFCGSRYGFNNSNEKLYQSRDENGPPRSLSKISSSLSRSFGAWSYFQQFHKVEIILVSFLITSPRLCAAWSTYILRALSTTMFRPPVFG